MKPVLPKLQEVVVDEWKIIFYEEYSSLFLSHNNLDEDLKKTLDPFLEKKFNDYRSQLKFKATSFLVGFFHREREIRFYTPRLNLEFTLLESYKDFPSDSEFTNFKKHTDKMASLSMNHFPSVWAELTERHHLPDLLRDNRYREIQYDMQKLKESLSKEVDRYRASLLEKMTDYGLDVVTRFNGIRIYLLKFLTSVPAFEHDKSREAIKKLLQESLRRLIDSSFKQKPVIGAAHFFVSILSYIPSKMIYFFLFLGIKIMAKRFIAGSSLEKAEKAMKRLYKTKRDATLDQLGETVLCEEDAQNYLNKCLILIRGFSKYTKKGERNLAQIFKANVSIKVTALSSHIDIYNFDKTYESIGPRLKEIFLVAKEEQVFINVDAEHYHYRDLVFKIYKKILLETKELEAYSGIGIVLQAYLRDAYEHFYEILNLAQERKVVMPIRLVKGAYWDTETLIAEGGNLPAWHFLNKEETDLHFRQLIIKILENYPHVQLAVASHNFADQCFSEIFRNRYYKNHPPVEHQCLDMTSEALSEGMARLGWVVRNYVPVGDYLVGMAYFVRRILENSSQVGILSQMRSGHDLKHFPSPEDIYVEKIKSHKMRHDQVITDLSGHFFNTPSTLLYKDEERKYFETEIVSLPEIHHFSVSISDELETMNLNYHEGKWAKASSSVRASFFLRLSLLLEARKNKLMNLFSSRGLSLNSALGEFELLIDSISFYTHEEILYAKKNPQALSRGVWGMACEKEMSVPSFMGGAIATLVAGNSLIALVEKSDLALATYLFDLFKEIGIPSEALVLREFTDAERIKKVANSTNLSGMIYFGHRSQGLLLSSELGRNIRNNKGEIRQVPFLADFGAVPLVVLGHYADVSHALATFCTLPDHKDLKIIIPHSLRDSFTQKVKKIYGENFKKWEILFFANLEEAACLVNSFECIGQTFIHSESLDEIDWFSKSLKVPNLQINKKFEKIRIGEFPLNTMKLTGLHWRLGGKNMMDFFHHIPKKIPATTLPAEGRGSDYQFRLALPSEIDLPSYSEILNKTFEVLIKNFEVLFPGVYGGPKENLIGFKNWIKSSFLHFRLNYHLNGPLTHLMNADNYRLPIEETVLLAFNERPHYSIFMQTLGAICMGSGVTVMTRNQEAYEWWTKMKNLCVMAGLSKANFDVFFSTKKIFEKTLENPCLGAIIFDGQSEMLEKMLPLIFDEHSSSKKRIRCLRSAFDAPSDNDYERLLRHFAQVRSFSFNIVRQGCKMEVDTVI